MKKFFFTYYGILAAIIVALMAFGAFGDEVLTLDERIVALTLLGEARGEGANGMLAVGCVIQQRSINRAKRPATICLQPKQFSCWPFKGGIRAAERKLFSEDKNATAYARELARKIVRGDKLDRSEVGYADHFHAKWVTKTDEDGKKKTVLMKPPYWAKDRNATKTIGNHIFYNL